VKPLVVFALAVFLAAPSVMATNLEQCVHLLDRSSFGVDRKDLLACLQDPGYEQTVKRLLKTTKVSENPPAFAREVIRPPKKFKELSATERQAFNKRKRAQQIALKMWWIDKMLKTFSPFRERMVLFWHNHFTSSLRKIQQPALLYRQNQLFRRYAVGNFAQLLHRIIEDPAMLIYLDNRANRKKHPNENLARELMELFTLGEGHYSEKDIKELSRALTGYGVDRNLHFRFRPRWHDSGKKELFGKKGNFDAHRAVDLILQRKETAIFIVRKFWKTFVDDTPNQREVQRIAEIFRKNRYELKPMLYALFTSPFFTAPYNRGTLVKSPIELLVGTLRSLGERSFDPRIVMQYSRRLGQDLFDPPNVKGWPGGSRWIDANTLLIRKEFLGRLTRGKAMLQIDRKIFENPQLGATPDRAAARLLLPTQVYLIPARNFGGTLQTILQHPLYQLK